MSNESFLQVLIQDTGERRLLAIGLVYEFHLQHYLPGWGSPGEPTVGYHVDDGRIFDAKDPVNGRELSGTVFTLFFVYRWSSLLSNLLATVVHMFNPRSILEKLVTRSLEGGGGFNRTPPPFYFRQNSSNWLEIWYILQASFVLSIKRIHVVSNWFPWQQ